MPALMSRNLLRGVAYLTGQEVQNSKTGEAS